MLKSKNAGFTIVELLIVIVVIGILAAITIVAFNGVQNRAKDTAQITLVSQWESILKLYVAEHGSLPVTVSDRVCLGTSYPASGVFSLNSCHFYEQNGYDEQRSAVEPDVINKFREVATIPSQSPDSSGFVATDGTDSMKFLTRGVALTMNQASTPHSNYKLEYGVTGNKCPSGDEGDETATPESLEPGDSVKGNLCVRRLFF
ncbi:hypothetical protein A2791_05285 [Candidatus Saccharibacteria bacterium RIFCSPHIGHO2_01_FULL_46_30]|nr:MAG: hypothetical protein A2791_05285 [Candidatus Saccharibacteria bacterium RIFCSPHIGHO2_01_FULL_46_30]